MAFIRAVQGLSPGQEIAVEGNRAVLGRHPECDIVLDVGAVSRQHAQILREGDDYYAEDLKSRNGTFVNEEVVVGRRLLRENDLLKICDLVFSFHLDRQAAPDVTIAAPEVESAVPALMIDEPAGTGTSTIMTKLDVSANRSGLSMKVSPEVKLKTLLEITRDLSSAIDLDQILKKVLDSLFKIFIQADRGYVVLKEGEGGKLVPRAVKHRRADQEDTIRISRTIVNQAMASKEAILSADAATDSRFDSSQSIADFRIRSMICAPLLDSEGDAFGVLEVDTLDQRSRFAIEDLELLATVAAQAGFAVEHARLHEAALRKQALDRDLQLAHKVQQGLLPRAAPQIDGYDFFHFYEPANQVGGDYFDYVPLPNKRLGVVLADVSGKGMPAALLMAKLSSETRYCLASEPTPAAALSQLNRNFCSAGWEDRFVTLLMLVLDTESHQVTMVNAGHMSPYLRHADRTLEAVGESITGVPIGVVDGFEYEQCSLTLAPGESLTSFTDGFSEAMNIDNELYGFERLETSLKSDISDLPTLGKSVLDAVKLFAGNRRQSDDMCLLCLGRRMP